MPRFDFKCPVCAKLREETFKTVVDADRANLYCSDCTGARLMRMPVLCGFTIKGYNAKNGYAK